MAADAPAESAFSRAVDRFEVDAARRERWLDAASRAYVRLQMSVGEASK